MLKKSLIACASLALTTGIAMANGAPYIGGSVGVVTNTSNSNGLSLNNSSYRGVPFMLNAGYGYYLSQNFYLGGELFGTVGTLELNNDGLKTTYGYGASIIPGLMISDHTMTYARAGLVRTRFSPAASSNTTVTGGQLGLGLQTGLTQNLDLRGEYVYTAYRTFSTISSPRADQVNLGLIYKFD